MKQEGVANRTRPQPAFSAVINTGTTVTNEADQDSTLTAVSRGLQRTYAMRVSVHIIYYKKAVLSQR